MTNPPEIKRYAGIAEETSPGVPAAGPEFDIDVKSCTPGDPQNPEEDYPSSLSQGKTIHRPGNYVYGPSINCGVDMKTFARMIYFALGKRLTKATEGAGTGINPEAVLYYDDSADSYTSKKTAFINATANDINVPGHAEAEIGDELLIGDNNQFAVIAYTIGTAKTDTSTLLYKYWDGDEWKELTVSDASSGFTVPGDKSVTWTPPVDWETLSINNSAPLYWVKVECTAFTTAANQGKITSGTIGTVPDTLTEYIYSSESILLPTYTLFMGMDINEHVVAGNVADSFELTVDTGFLDLKLDSKAMTKTIREDGIRDLTDLKLNDDYPLTAPEVNLHFREKGSNTAWGASTRISTETKKLNMSVKRNASEADGQCIGQRTPGVIPIGARDIGLGFDYLYLTDDWIARLNGGGVTPGEGISSTEFEMMLEIDGGEYGDAQVYFPRVIVSSAPLSASGRGQIVQSIQLLVYMEDITIPTTEPTDVKTDVLVTINHYFPDTTAGADYTWPPTPGY